jgi:hypothetical protein
LTSAEERERERKWKLEIFSMCDGFYLFNFGIPKKPALLCPSFIIHTLGLL